MGISHGVDIFTPHAAEVTVGWGSPMCAHDFPLLVTQDVAPKSPTPGVHTEFTHAVTAVDIMSSDTAYVCEIEDLLPPAFTTPKDQPGPRVFTPGDTSLRRRLAQAPQTACDVEQLGLLAATPR